MAQIIQIENGLVQLIDHTVRQSVPLEEWLPRIEKRSPIYTPVLPTNARAVWWDPTDLTNQRLMLLLEVQPQIIHMTLRGVTRELSIPWTRFVFYAKTNNAHSNAWTLNDYRVFWAKSRYSDPALTDMIPALVPNVYGDGRICFGNTGVRADMTLADRLDQTVNEFYVSNFNHDLSIRYPNDWTGYTNWVRMTRADPTAWINWPDFDNNNHNNQHFSWTNINERFMNEEDRRDTVVINADPIPPLALGATFGRIADWIRDLTDDQRHRLLLATNQIAATAPNTFAAAEEDEDFGDEPDEVTLT